MLHYVEETKPDVVVIWSTNELRRTMIDTLNTVIVLVEKRIKVISVKEGWLQTLDDNARRLILSIL